jgi:hypothetical protein
MPTHKGFIVLGLVLAVAALGSPAALGKAPGTDRSLDGTISGTAGGVFEAFRGEGTGHLTHLGKTTMTIEGTIVPIEQDFARLNGAITFVSASGAELTGTFRGFARLNDGVSLEVTITGGTGRFDDASGTLTVVGSNEFLDPSPNPGFLANFVFPFTGEISY